MTEYVTVFNFVDNRSWHLWLAIGLLIFCVIISLTAILLLVYYARSKKMTQGKRMTKWVIICGLLLFYVFLPLRTFVKVASEYLKFYDVYKNGEYEILEGVVNVIQYQPVHGHGNDELIEISGKKLYFDYFKWTFAYDITISHGGCLKNGVRARLFVYQGNILRVDIVVNN